MKQIKISRRIRGRMFSVDAALELVIETNNIDNGNKIQASCFHADFFKSESKNKLKVFPY